MEHWRAGVGALVGVVWPGAEGENQLAWGFSGLDRGLLRGIGGAGSAPGAFRDRAPPRVGGDGRYRIAGWIRAFAPGAGGSSGKRSAGEERERAVELGLRWIGGVLGFSRLDAVALGGLSRRSRSRRRGGMARAAGEGGSDRPLSWAWRPRPAAWWPGGERRGCGIPAGTWERGPWSSWRSGGRLPRLLLTPSDRLAGPPDQVLGCMAPGQDGTAPRPGAGSRTLWRSWTRLRP